MTKLFVPFNIRNKILNDDKKDITDYELKDHYQVLSSYMKEKDIHDSFEKRKYNNLIKGIKTEFGIKYDNFKKGINDKISDIKYAVEHPYSSLNCGFLINPYRFTVVVPNLDDTSLKSYWKFNEASGNIINQSQSAADLGSNADITITGATYAQTGKKGDALLFDGVNDYGECGTSLSQWNFIHNQSALFTYAGWIKRASTPASEQNIFATDNNGSYSEYGFALVIDTSNSVRFHVLNGGGVGYTMISNAGTNYFNDTTAWHFLCLTYDYSLGSNNVECRLDDANLIQDTKTANAASNTNAGLSGKVGVRGDATTGWFNAYYDEVSIWNKVMSTGNQTSLYNSGSGLEIY